jgi:hypothetical protein
MGVSFPMGRGKRIWFSGSIVAWLTIIPVFAAIWAAGWILGGILYLIVQGIRKAAGK